MKLFLALLLQLLTVLAATSAIFLDYSGGKWTIVRATRPQMLAVTLIAAIALVQALQAVSAGKRNFPKWVLIPSDLHTAADAAGMLARRVN